MKCLDIKRLLLLIFKKMKKWSPTAKTRMLCNMKQDMKVMNGDRPDSRGSYSFREAFEVSVKWNVSKTVEERTRKERTIEKYFFSSPPLLWSFSLLSKLSYINSLEIRWSLLLALRQSAQTCRQQVIDSFHKDGRLDCRFVCMLISLTKHTLK